LIFYYKTDRIRQSRSELEGLIVVNRNSAAEAPADQTPQAATRPGASSGRSPDGETGGARSEKKLAGDKRARAREKALGHEVRADEYFPYV
jgi:hypothetical protein